MTATPKSRRNTYLLLGILGVLIIAVAILATLNYRDASSRAARTDDSAFSIIVPDETIKVTREDIEGMGLKTVDTILDTSITLPEEVSYEGVSLKDLLASKGIEYGPDNTIVAHAKDGYTSAYSYKDVNTDDGVFVVVSQEGKALKSQKDGGMGPFLIVTTHDQFSQRWCKYLSEIRID